MKARISTKEPLDVLADLNKSQKEPLHYKKIIMSNGDIYNDVSTVTSVMGQPIEGSDQCLLIWNKSEIVYLTAAHIVSAHFEIQEEWEGAIE